MALPVGAIDPALITPNPAAGKAASFSEPIGPQDAKSQLMQFAQRFTKKPVQKGDILYTPFKFAGGFQCKVKMICVDGKEFVGEMASTSRDAEQAAAIQALLGYKDQVDVVNAASDGKKRKITIPSMGAPVAKVARVAGPGGGGGGGASLASMTAKSDLNMHVSRIARCAMDKNAINYETAQVPGGFQCKLVIPCLGGIWTHHAFQGEVLGKKTDAEQSVAAIALAAIKLDPQLMNKANQPPNRVTKPGGPNYRGNKGGGKGNSAVQQVQAQAPSYNQLAQAVSLQWGQGWNPAMARAGMNTGQFNMGFSSL